MHVSTVECRSPNCHFMAPETAMTPAKKVLKRNARGYYCDRCAALYAGVRGLDR
jgi:hypothetical protein